jgi:RNA polymerase sigma-70 factor (ECF subfamily)
VNQCLDFLRGRQAKMARATGSYDEDEASEPVARAPVVPTAISRVDLERAIARLPDGCRTAFVLHDVEGFAHHEVGSMLGISEGTSKSQVHKARARLRAILSGALR